METVEKNSAVGGDMNEKLKTCPFCGWKARIHFKNYKFSRWREEGQRKLKYRVQVICNKCHSRGKPIVTDWLINASPYCVKDEERFKPYVEEAINAWNKRVEK